MANIDENPFAALLNLQPALEGINKGLVEKIFLFTLRKDLEAGSQLLTLADVILADLGNENTMSEELLSHAVFERLMLMDTRLYVPEGGKPTEDTLETEAITYLHRAFVACEEASNTQQQTSKMRSDCEKIRNIILRNASTCMRQPELFQSQALHTQWLKILEKSDEVDTVTQEFLVQIVIKIMADDIEIEALGALKSIFYPMLSDIQKHVVEANLITLKKSIFCTLDYFVRDKRVPQLGEILIDYWTPNPNANGREYMETLLGQMLCISIMPKTSHGPYEYFAEITFEAQCTDHALWQMMSNHQQSLFLLVKQLLVLNPTTKQKMLQWIANCLQANVARGQLWNSISPSFETVIQSASDSFMIGLNAVLLRLCAPLCEPTLKVLLVDPTYSALSNEQRSLKKTLMLKLNDETCLLSVEENEQRPIAAKYNFITELFYMTHKSFELGYNTCIQRYTRIKRDLHNMQSAYRDVMNSNPASDMAKNLLRMLRQQMQQYLCLRNGLMEPTNDTSVIKFLEASAIWLTEIALISSEEFGECEQKVEYAPLKRQNRGLPDTIDFVPSTLKCVPECIIDNVAVYLNFTRHFDPGQYIEVYQSSHDAFFKMIVLFMGHAELVKNPHLRAKLSEALEILLPNKSSTDDSMGHSISSRVFETHAERLKVLQSLLNVFVSIEMTGQSVQFEQKFIYRRPMYAIMEYLWSQEEQVQCFRKLAEEAELNMEAIEPPIFLRFINLLINDAIFLLDDSLSNLQRIRELQEAQLNGEWDNLQQNERNQHMANLHHMGMLARLDNILGRETINILKLITIEIKSIFCHNSMVDRVAAMLNYFLLNLVGPQKEKFKVKGKKEFEFDPAQTVLEICRIYINLSSSDKFCLAISQDGRSYSSKLFEYAEGILVRIGGGQLIGDMSEFAAKVQQMEAQYKEEQEFLADAPDEYLDPIMSTLMMDPVILPSSNVTVDRTTIARHLLSDQTDPFNRAPLTMDKVKPNHALKADIEKWIAEKRAAGTAASTATTNVDEVVSKHGETS